MKILVVVPSLHDGGAERVVSELTKEWAKDHEVVVALFDGSSPVYETGGRIVDLGLPGSMRATKKTRNAVLRPLRLGRVLRRERPDRIVSFMEGANFPAIVATVLTGYLDRLYVSVHCNPAMNPLVYRVPAPRLYRLPAGVVAVSEGVKRGLESMNVPSARISVIPNPVAGPEARAFEHGPSPLADRFVLGAGRLAREKGFDRLVAAFAALGRRDVRLVILGEGTERESLVRLTRQLGVDDLVHLPGRVADIGRWYRYAACCVLSSRHEGWPNVLGEAMVHGCPVVSFDCPYGPSEMIEDGENGLLVADGDVEALTAAIARVLGDAALRRRLAAGGMEWAKQFEVETIAARWLADRGRE